MVVVALQFKQKKQCIRYALFKRPLARAQLLNGFLQGGVS